MINVAHSKEAATYDNRHEKALTQITENIRARLDFLGVDWADEDDNEDEAGGDTQGEGKPKRPVRLLDYACGTGTVSRVSTPPSSVSVLLWYLMR